MSNKNYFKKIKYYFKRYGFFATIKKIFRRIFQIKENKTIDQNFYKAWLEKNNLSHLKNFLNN